MADDTVQRACEAAQERVGAGGWITLTPAQRAAAIYSEIRELDSLTVGLRRLDEHRALSTRRKAVRF